MTKPDRPWWFYREPNGDYLAVDPDTRRPSLFTKATFIYTARRAYAGFPTFIQTVRLSAEYLPECTPVEDKDVPDEWWSAITDIPATERRR